MYFNGIHQFRLIPFQAKGTSLLVFTLLNSLQLSLSDSDGLLQSSHLLLVGPYHNIEFILCNIRLHFFILCLC